MVKKSFISLALCGLLVTPLVVLASTDVVGKGEIAISASDPESVKGMAQKKALTNAILSAISNKLGSDVPEGDPRVQKLINEVDIFIDNKNFERDRDAPSSMYVTKAILKINDTKFAEALNDAQLGLDTKTQNSGSVVVFLDEVVKLNSASMDQVPLNETMHYSRDNSTAYNEKENAKSASAKSSSFALSDKEAGYHADKSAVVAKASSEASYNDKMAAKSSSHAALSDGYSGYAAGRSNDAVSASSKGSAKDSASYAARSESKDAYAKDLKASGAQAKASSSSYNKNINSKVNDKEEFFYEKKIDVEALKPQATMGDDMRKKLQGELLKFGVTLKTDTGSLQEYNKQNKKDYKSYSEILHSPDRTKFLKSIKMSTKADYIGAGVLEIGYDNAQDNTGDFRCALNQGNIEIYSLSTEDILSSEGLTSLKQANSTKETCQNNVRSQAATELGAIVGKSIQKKVRNQNREIASSIAPVIKVVIKGQFDRKTRSSFQEMMTSLNAKGIKGFNQLPSDDGLVYEISYDGKSPLGDLLLDSADTNAILQVTFTGYDIKKQSDGSLVITK